MASRLPTRTYIVKSAEYGGPEHRRIAAVAAENGITVVLGVSERDAEGRIFITQWIIDETGKTETDQKGAAPMIVRAAGYRE